MLVFNIQKYVSRTCIMKCYLILLDRLEFIQWMYFQFQSQTTTACCFPVSSRQTMSCQFFLQSEPVSPVLSSVQRCPTVEDSTGSTLIRNATCCPEYQTLTWMLEWTTMRAGCIRESVPVMFLKHVKPSPATEHVDNLDMMGSLVYVFFYM